MRRSLLLLLIVLVLAGCGGGTAAPTDTAVVTVVPTAVASPEATQAPSATPVEPTPTHAPSATATLPPPPTVTLAPSSTQLPPPSPTPPVLTPAPTPSPAPVAAWWEVISLLVGPGNPGRLYALQQRRDRTYAYPDQTRLLVSDDGGLKWSPFAGELPAKGCVHSVSMDYAQIDALYACTCQGLYRWSGSGWDLASAQDLASVAVVYGQPQVLWAIQTPDKGDVVIRSDDGGATWTPAATGLVHFNGVAVLGVDPTNADRLYAIIWPKYAGSYLRRGTGSGVWEMMPAPNDNAVVDPGMAIDGPTGNLYVVTSLSPYQLWRSTNPGADLAAIQWEMLHDFGPDVWVHLLAAGPGDPGPALYANITTIGRLGGGFIDVGPALLQRSPDNGKTWTALPIPNGDN